MLGFEIESGLVDDLAKRLHANEEQVKTALSKSLNTFESQFEKRVMQLVAQKERIPQYAISDRFFSNNVAPGDDELKVWIGTWAVEPFSMGTPSQSLSGVRAGRRNYPGAFIASIYTMQEKVWIRLHSPHYSPDLYPTNYRPGDRGLADHNGRFPVVKAAVPIDDTVASVISSEHDEFVKMFEKLLNDELVKAVDN